MITVKDIGWTDFFLRNRRKERLLLMKIWISI